MISHSYSSPGIQSTETCPLRRSHETDLQSEKEQQERWWRAIDAPDLDTGATYIFKQTLKSTHPLEIGKRLIRSYYRSLHKSSGGRKGKGKRKGKKGFIKHNKLIAMRNQPEGHHHRDKTSKRRNFPSPWKKQKRRRHTVSHALKQAYHIHEDKR